jgi:hypothetical protein
MRRVSDVSHPIIFSLKLDIGFGPGENTNGTESARFDRAAEGGTQIQPVEQWARLQETLLRWQLEHISEVLVLTKEQTRRQ